MNIILTNDPIGPLQDTITCYKITGTQTAHWDIQNKEDLSLSDLSRFVLDVPVRSLRSSMADFALCDRILQKAYCFSALRPPRLLPVKLKIKWELILCTNKMSVSYLAGAAYRFEPQR